jgi:hypothetical protein
MNNTDFTGFSFSLWMETKDSPATLVTRCQTRLHYILQVSKRQCETLFNDV